MTRQHLDHGITSNYRGMLSAGPGERTSWSGQSAMDRWDPSIIALPGLTLWFEAGLIQSSTNSPNLIAPAAAVAGTIGLFVHAPVLSKPVWFRLMLAVLGVFLLVRLAVFPPDTLEIGFVVLSRSATIAVAELFLWCQALVLWRLRAGDPVPIAFCCLALLTAVFALNRILPPGAETAYVMVVTVSLLLPTLIATSRATSARSRHETLPWSAQLVLGLVCGSVFVGTWTITKAWSTWTPIAQNWLAEQIGGSPLDPRRLAQYPVFGTLTAIQAGISDDPNATALRVYSDTCPGYLAGRVYDQYRDGQWRMLSEVNRRRSRDELRNWRSLEPLRSVPESIGTVPYNLCVFEVHGLEFSGPPKRMEIKNDGRRGLVVFRPLGYRYLLGSGELAMVDEHDIVRSGVNVRRPYVVIAGTTSPVAPLSDQMRQLLLTPLPDLDASVTDTANRIARRAFTTQDKIRAVCAYFEDNYEYSLEPVEAPRGIDPLAYFLSIGHPAHCEFFASAAVALLRLQGVPARYASGFRVMQLEEDSDNCWIALNSNAHAWAEAFDEQLQRWVIVEATPGFPDPTEDDLLSAGQDPSGFSGFGSQFSTGKIGALVQAWKRLPAGTRVLLLAIFAAATGSAICIGVRRVRSLRRSAAQSLVGRRVNQYHRLLRHMDRRLKKRGVTRFRAETLHQFADRIGRLADGEDIGLESCANWYLKYAVARFGTENLSPPMLLPKTASSGKRIRQRGNSP